MYSPKKKYKRHNILIFHMRAKKRKAILVPITVSWDRVKSREITKISFSNAMLKYINDFCVCLEKGRKHLKTRSGAIYWLNSQQFIWHSNHTTRLNNIVYTTAIACHLQEEEDDDIWQRDFSPSNSPPPAPAAPSSPTLTVTRHKVPFELPRTFSSPIHSPRQIEMDSLFRPTQEFRKSQLTPIKDD